MGGWPKKSRVPLAPPIAALASRAAVDTVSLKPSERAVTFSRPFMLLRKPAASGWGKAGPDASTKSWVSSTCPGSLVPVAPNTLIAMPRCVETASESSSPGPTAMRTATGYIAGWAKSPCLSGSGKPSRTRSSPLSSPWLLACEARTACL